MFGLSTAPIRPNGALYANGAELRTALWERRTVKAHYVVRLPRVAS